MQTLHVETFLVETLKQRSRVTDRLLLLLTRKRRTNRSVSRFSASKLATDRPVIFVDEPRDVNFPSVRGSRPSLSGSPRRSKEERRGRKIGERTRGRKDLPRHAFSREPRGTWPRTPRHGYFRMRNYGFPTRSITFYRYW